MKNSHLLVILLTGLLTGVTSARTWVNNKGVDVTLHPEVALLA